MKLCFVIELIIDQAPKKKKKEKKKKRKEKKLKCILYPTKSSINSKLDHEVYGDAKVSISFISYSWILKKEEEDLLFHFIDLLLYFW